MARRERTERRAGKMGFVGEGVIDGEGGAE